MARAIWNGSISFGLINIPVELHSLEKKVDLNLHLIDTRDQARIHYVRVNEETGDEVEWDQISKGYEYKDGQYVTLDKDTLAEMQIKSSENIDLEEFVDLDEIPYYYFDKPYMLVPKKTSAKSYAVLYKALAKANKAALGKVTIRTREHLAAIVAHENCLILNLLRFAAEIKGMETYDVAKLTKNVKVSPKEQKLAEQLIESLSSEWDPTHFKDEYGTTLHKYVANLAKQAKSGKLKQIKRKTKKSAAKKKENVIDIASLLKESLKENRSHA